MEVKTREYGIFLTQIDKGMEIKLSSITSFMNPAEPT